MFDATQPQVEQTANQPDNADAGIGDSEQISEPFMTVRYNKENMPLSKEAATTYAQKGLNYDKLSERLSDATAQLSKYDDFEKLTGELAQNNGMSRDQVMIMMREQLSLGMDENTAKQAVVDKQLAEFMQSNPGLDPRALPETVLNAWRQGVPLSEAMLSHQASEYRQQAEALQAQIKADKANASNTTASMGRPQSNGSRQKRLSEETIKGMTKAELDKNHDRIWAYLTGTKKKG